MDAETKQRISDTVISIITASDLDSITISAIRAAAAARLNLDLSLRDRKLFVRSVIDSFMQSKVNGESKGKSDPEEEKEVRGEKRGRGDREYDDQGNLIICHLSAKKRVTMQTFKGNKLVSIREYYMKNGKHMPSTKGPWTLKEYTLLNDLVRYQHSMMTETENISWQAVADKLATRSSTDCFNTWCSRLSCSLVNDGLWLDTDDYRMMYRLNQLDACCVEDVDWDNLLNHRSGEICRKRWDQLARRIGGHKEKSFLEELDVLAGWYRFAPVLHLV